MKKKELRNENAGVYQKTRSESIDMKYSLVPQFIMRKEMKWRSNGGQGMVEYGLIIGLIAIIVLTIFVVLRNVVNLGEEGSGTLSEESMERNQASLSAGLYN